MKIKLQCMMASIMDILIKIRNNFGSSLIPRVVEKSLFLPTVSYLLT